MNKVSMLGSAAAIVVMTVAGAASAADLAVKVAPVVSPVPAFSWTGCYIGAHGGGAVMNDSWAGDHTLNEIGSPADLHGTGAVVGGQTGCNYQFGMLVLGIEGEGFWSSLQTTYGSSPDTDPLFQRRYDYQTKNKSDWDVAARFGLAFDRALAYGKIGVIWGAFDFAVSFSNSIGAANYSAGSATLNGILIGAGLEYALAQNWTVKIEYNYVNFAAHEVGFSGCDNSPRCYSFRESHGADKHIVKLGANFKFW